MAPESFTTLSSSDNASIVSSALPVLRSILAAARASMQMGTDAQASAPAVRQSPVRAASSKCRPSLTGDAHADHYQRRQAQRPARPCHRRFRRLLDHAAGADRRPARALQGTRAARAADLGAARRTYVYARALRARVA